MNVKKFLAFTTVCAAALLAGANITAYADGGLTIPEDFSVEFTLERVNDYAVEGNSFAFASGARIYVYSSSAVSGTAYSDGTLATYAHSSDVTAVEYSDGSLYFSDGSATYLYSDGSATTAEFTFAEYGKYVEDGDYLYSVNNSSYITITDQNNNDTPTTVVSDATYSSLKSIDGVIYVLKGSSLCTVSGGTISQLSFSYDDYESVGAIAVGDTAEALKSAQSVQTATIAEGACLIRTDLDQLSGDYFQTSDVTFAAGSESAQILYNPDGGNAALIAIGGKSYLTLKSNLTAKEFTTSSSGTAYAYFLDSAGIYSLPYCSQSTRLASVDAGTVVTVTGTAYSDAFDYDYYKVEYSANGETVTGYALTSLLTSYTFADDGSDGNIVADEPTTENNVTTVILVMVIVVLVLIAVGYITYVATAKSYKKNDNK